MVINLLYHQLTTQYYTVDGNGHCLIHTSDSVMNYSLSYDKKEENQQKNIEN